MKGWVYIITNKSMPNLVKVGFSTKDPEQRAAELNNTGVPHPYKVEYDVLVDNPRAIEQKAHLLLKDCKERKEWFKCSTENAIIAIRDAAGSGIMAENNQHIKTAELEAEIKKRKDEKTRIWEQKKAEYAQEKTIKKEQMLTETDKALKLKPIGAKAFVIAAPFALGLGEDSSRIICIVIISAIMLMSFGLRKKKKEDAQAIREKWDLEN